MRKFYLLPFVFVLAMLFGLEGYGQDTCRFENFDNLELPGTAYVDGSFVGNDGITWSYFSSRDENGDLNNSGIDGNAIMLRNAATNSRITSSTISGGIIDFSVKLYKGFTGGGDRQVELFVNGVSQGTSTPFDDFDEHIFTVNGIDVSGDVIIEIRNITSKQIIVDDISWTCAEEPVYDCPILVANIGDACNDGNSSTWNDVVNSDCECVGTPVGDFCGFENFNTSEIAASYGNGSFIGNDGIIWSYIAARDENGDFNNSGIDGNAILLRRVADNSSITSSTISGGISDFSVRVYKGFTGGGDRQVELFINGDSYGTSDPFDDYDVHAFQVHGIDISGDFTIEIRNVTSRQIILDDITWSCYPPVVFDCPVLGANIGDSCNDGDATTENDEVTSECECAGTPIIPEDEPSDHPTDFACEGVDLDEIYVEWTDVSSSPEPSGYLILWSDISYGSIVAPVDGTPIDDGSNALNVSQGIEIAAIQGLATNTDYFFKIFPYTNSGSNIAYKTDVAVQTSCNTMDGPCIDEGFSGGNTAPTGWVFTGLGTPYNTSGNYGVSSPSLKFDNSDDRILTSFSTNPASEVSFWLKGQGTDAASALLVEGYDGSSWVTIQNIKPLPTVGTTYTYNPSSSPSLPANLIQFRFTYTKGAGNLAFDDLEVLCTTACIPNQTVEGFSPHSGPEGTLVTITGSGFTGATDVRIGGNSVTFLPVEDDNTIHVIIDDVPVNGLVSVIVSDCEAKSADSFSYLKSNGVCSNSTGSEPVYATDLFISEVYDGSGSLSYIEIFNGTNGVIDLGAGNYSIHVTTGPTQIYELSGTVLSGKMHILQIGSSGVSECDNFVVNDPRPSAPGFNGDDIVSLYKNGSLLDYVPNPNHLDAGGTGTKAPGFSQSRNDHVISPSTTYINSEWTVSNTENCDDLGIAPYIPGGKNITITTHPLDVDCTELTFSVEATTNISPYVPSTYRWYYIGPGDLTWKLVSTLGGTNGLAVTPANQPSITITGNTSILLGYQFYVDMGTGGDGECRRYSNVASYTFGTKSFYRTVSGGDWSNLDIWEMSDVEFGTYEEVCQYPIDRTSDKVTIRDGAHVILDVEIAVEWIDICATCTLELERNEKLTVMNGNLAGPDLIINGTLIDKGNNLNGINFLTPATWQLGAAGIVIKTNTSSVVAYRDNYEVDIANIPASGQWIYRRIDNNNISVASIGMVYPNLSFENDFGSSNYDPVNSLYMFSGNSLPIRIKGDLNVGMDGSGTYTLRTINSFSNPILIEGSLNIGLGSGLYNQAGVVFGTGLEVQGNMDIQGTLDLTAGSGTNVGILKLSGNQNMTIGPGPAIPNNTIKSNYLEIAKEEGFNLHSKLNFEINESATFTQGILELENAVVTFNPGAVVDTLPRPSNNSFVDGKVIKHGTSEPFTFPIGDTSGDTIAWYQPVRMFDYTGSSTVEAEYFAEAEPNAGPYYNGNSNTEGDNREIGNCDYWNVMKTAGEAVRLGFAYTNTDPDYCNKIIDNTYLSLARWNSLMWEYPIDEGVNPNGVLGEISSIGTITNYGHFALSGPTGDKLIILPIELISFTAKPENKKVQTQWSTHSETNNAFFTVERSADARVFHKIGEVTGAGNSHTAKHYALTDPRPLPNTSYYRLKQTDFDGRSSYSDIQAVSFKETDGFSLDLTYRDENELNLVYKSISPYILVEIFDVLGKRVFTQVAENYGGRSVLNPNLGRGAYVVRISAGDKSDTGKIVW